MCVFADVGTGTPQWSLLGCTTKMECGQNINNQSTRRKTRLKLKQDVRLSAVMSIHKRGYFFFLVSIINPKFCLAGFAHLQVCLKHFLKVTPNFFPTTTQRVKCYYDNRNDRQ